MPRIIRFGPFELDVQTAELRKHGVKLRLHEQPFRILVMLLNQPGEVVSREDLRKVLWPNDTVVEFEHSINAAIQRLRDALGDSAAKPRYVETLPRRGYRFIGAVEPEPEPEHQPQPDAPKDVPDARAADLTGKILDHYRIVGKLGEGGMGVVYRAEDLKLGRQVAIKFLPGADRELPESMLRRFEREARAASALNHPHICTVHGLEDFGGQPAIVMELVEGETLAARLARGPLPLAQSLALAAQVAGAVGEAHRRGIVHRDLKPANIMLTKSGAKVLDFGLAKMERAAAAAEAETVTQKGAIVGTLHYMSPEQVQGKDADARSDIFSFGLVLYEMLTGRRAFEGESAASVMAGILEREPSPLESSIPPALNRLMLRCLAKDPEERWQSARDLKTELEWIAEAAPPQPRTYRRAGAAWLSVALFAAVAAVTLFNHLREKPPESRVVRLQIPPPGKFPFTGNDAPVLSPDGTRIVFSNSGKLFVRSLDSLALQELAGTEDGHFPFWSPDGRSVVFFAGLKLKKISLLGGLPAVLCSVYTPPGGAWNRDGVIVFPPNPTSSLMRIESSGGTPVPVTRLNTKKGETGHAWPSFLPDGKHFLFTVHAKDPANSGVFIGSLDFPQVTHLLPDETNAQYTEPGYVVFSRAGNLMAQPFDAGRLRFTGDPAVVAQGVLERVASFATFSASAGVLAYRTGRPEGPFRFRWFDRKGTPLGDVGPAGTFPGWDLSPDGHALAINMTTASGRDIWVFDLVRGTNSRVTSGGGGEPSWSPDSRQIAFTIDGQSPSVVRVVAANGSGKEELVAQLDRNAMVDQWTADGQYLILSAGGFEKPWEVWAVPMSGGGKPFPVVTGPFNNHEGYVSRDGKWIAYAGDQTGEREIYVQDFPPKGGKWQISTAGGEQPLWRADGRELIYKSRSQVMSVEVKINAGRFEAGIPKPLFDLPNGAFLGAPPADRDKILLMVPNDEPGPPQPFTVVFNWPAGIKR